VLAALGPAVHAAAPEPPKLRLDPALATPIRTSIDATIVPADDAFEGRVILDLEVKQPTSVLWLNAAELDVHSGRLEADGKTWDATVLPGGSDFVGFQFAQQVPRGKARLVVAYKGVYEQTDTTGFFKQKDGDNWYVFSQMEPTDARRAFPCFDEPNYKTPWQVTLHIRQDELAVSNMPVLSETPEANGMKAVTFEETPPLPSYLVAIAVGPFEAVDAGTAGAKKTPLRIIVPKGRAAEAAYAASVTGEMVSRLETYFGIPYPYSKLDSLAIPQTVGFGAMENVGLITYVDRRLLIRADRATEEQRRGYASTGAHEIAHQWFGDLVTMQWWNDIWLNEGFATWMENRLLEDWKPEWGGDLEKVERRADVMSSDRLISARRVRQPIENEGDIRTSFDGITYEKGASLLAMYEEWMGRETFRKAISRYLKAHANSNATSSDFLAALAAEGGKDVAPSFASFLDQPGAPVVSVVLECATGKAPALHLSQKRFLPLGSAGSQPQTWQIPVRVRYSAGGKISTARKLLTATQGDLTLAGACPDWVQANDSGLGYYLVDYRGDLLKKLLRDGAPQLTTAERVGLLGDAKLLTSSGDLEIAELLAVLQPFAQAKDRLIVEAAMDIVERLREMVPAQEWPRYEAFVQRLFGDRARALGWKPGPADDADTRLLRSKLVALVADEGGDAGLRAGAAKLADAWLADPKSVDAEIAGDALAAAARSGDAQLFDRFLAAAKQTKDRQDRGKLLSALGRFRDPALIDRALGLVLSGDFDIRESQGMLRGINAEPAGRERSFAWLQQNYDGFAKAIPHQMLGRLPYYTANFCDDAHREAVAAFFKEKNIDQYDGGTRTLAQALESIHLCAAYRSAQAPSLEAYLTAN
jgi:alanyl aminopeptidase